MTRDGVKVALRSNIDLPGEADSAHNHGADGVGLYRTEFLVVGRATPPGEEVLSAIVEVAADPDSLTETAIDLSDLFDKAVTCHQRTRRAQLPH